MDLSNEFQRYVLSLKRFQNKTPVLISRIVEVYNYFKKREEERNQEYKKFFYSNIQPLLQGEEIYLPYKESNDGIYVYHFKNNNNNFDLIDSDGWSYTTYIIEPNNRESSLEYLLMDMNLLGLGQKLNSYTCSRRFLYYKIKQILIKNLEHYCRENIKTNDELINLKIGNNYFTLHKKNPYNIYSEYIFLERSCDVDVVDYLTYHRR